MAKKTKKMKNLLEVVTKKIIAGNYSEQIFNELETLAMLGRESEWELENTLFDGFSYDDSLEFIKKLQNILVTEINSKENTYSYLQLFRMIVAVKIISTEKVPKLTKKNPKVKFLILATENVPIIELLKSFKMVMLLDK